MAMSVLCRPSTTCPGSHDDFAVEALEHLLTNQPSGRLYQALVESGLAASVRGSAASSEGTRA